MHKGHRTLIKFLLLELHTLDLLQILPYTYDIVEDASTTSTVLKIMI